MTPEQISNLKHFIRILKKVHKNHFNMQHWYTGEDKRQFRSMAQVQHGCGTAACAFGYASLSPKLCKAVAKEKGLKWMGNDPLIFRNPLMMMNSNIFGFSREENAQIAYPCNYFDDPIKGDVYGHQLTPRQVIARIKELALKHGVKL